MELGDPPGRSEINRSFAVDWTARRGLQRQLQRSPSAGATERLDQITRNAASDEAEIGDAGTCVEEKIRKVPEVVWRVQGMVAVVSDDSAGRCEAGRDPRPYCLGQRDASRRPNRTPPSMGSRATTLEQSAAWVRDRLGRRGESGVCARVIMAIQEIRRKGTEHV